MAGTFVTFSAVFADRNEREYDDEEGYNVAPVTAPAAVEVQQQTVSTPKPKTYKQTIIVSPAQIVTEYQNKMVSFPDSDRDGIADADDKYPDIADIYIVKDDNGNGIVDTFED